jgi:hypothetical protein
MPEPTRTDDVEKFLNEQKTLEERKQALIDDLLRQRTDAIKAFDEKLARLGYNAAAAKRKRSHHKPSVPDPAAAKGKTKA